MISTQLTNIVSPTRRVSSDSQKSFFSTESHSGHASISRSLLLNLENALKTDTSLQIQPRSRSSSIKSSGETNSTEYPLPTSRKPISGSGYISPRKRFLKKLTSRSEANDSKWSSKNPFSLFKKHKKTCEAIRQMEDAKTTIKRKKSTQSLNQEDQISVFQYSDATIAVYRSDKEENEKSLYQSFPGSLIGHGVLNLYQVRNSIGVLYLTCGSVVYPLMQKTKIFKIDQNSFILPMLNPERYWKISLITEDYTIVKSLEFLFSNACQYQDLTDDQFIEQRELLQERTTTPVGEHILEEDLLPEPNLEAEKRDDSFPSHVASVVTEEQQDVAEQCSTPRIESTVACLGIDEKEPPINESTATSIMLFSEDELFSKDEFSQSDANTQLGLSPSDYSPVLKHPIPLRPPSAQSSLELILDKFKFDSEQEMEDSDGDYDSGDGNDTIIKALDCIFSNDENDNTVIDKGGSIINKDTGHVSSWMDTTDDGEDDDIRYKTITQRFSLRFKDIEVVNSKQLKQLQNFKNEMGASSGSTSNYLNEISRDDAAKHSKLLNSMRYDLDSPRGNGGTKKETPQMKSDHNPRSLLSMYFGW